MSAYSALKNGHSVTLYNKTGFPPYKSASAIAGGMLAPFSEIEHMTPAFIDAALASIALWQDFIASEAPHIPFLSNGSLLMAHHEDRHMLERFAAHLPSAPQSDWQTLDSRALHEKEPALPTTFNQAIYLPHEAAIHPHKTIEALNAYLHNHPRATLKTATLTPDKIQNDYDIVIDCRGSGAIEGSKDLRGIKGEIAIVHNPDFSLNHCVRIMHPRYPLYIVPRPHHIFMIGATQIESSAVQDGENLSVRSVMELLSSLYTLHPSFGEATLQSFHSGIRPAYPDNLPRITQNGNIITCNGMYRHGFLLSPIMAQSVCQMIAGKAADSLFTGNPSPHKTQEYAA